MQSSIQGIGLIELLISFSIFSVACLGCSYHALNGLKQSRLQIQKLQALSFEIKIHEQAQK